MADICTGDRTIAAADAVAAVAATDAAKAVFVIHDIRYHFACSSTECARRKNWNLMFAVSCKYEYETETTRGYTMQQ
jgi:hypothetical protein